MATSATIREPIYCRRCSYDLRGQETHRCPECGRPYDPADPKTFRRKPRGKTGRWIKRIALALAVLVLVASSPYAWLYNGWRREQPVVQRMNDLRADVGPEKGTRFDFMIPPRLRTW